MSTPLIVQGQIEVMNLLNAGVTANVFGNVTFTATRRYIVLNKKEDLANLTVSVIGGSNVSTFIARNQIEENPEIHIGIQKALAKSEDIDECDGLMLLVNQVSDYLSASANRVLPCKLALMKIANTPIYGEEHFKDQVFTSVLACTYEKGRVLP